MVLARPTATWLAVAGSLLVLVGMLVGSWLVKRSSGEPDQTFYFFSSLGLNPNNGATSPFTWIRTVALLTVVSVALATQFAGVPRALRITALVIDVIGVAAVAAAWGLVTSRDAWRIGWGVPTCTAGLIVLGAVLMRPELGLGRSRPVA